MSRAAFDLNILTMCHEFTEMHTELTWLSFLLEDGAA